MSAGLLTHAGVIGHGWFHALVDAAGGPAGFLCVLAMGTALGMPGRRSLRVALFILAAVAFDERAGAHGGHGEVAPVVVLALIGAAACTVRILWPSGGGDTPATAAQAEV